MTVRQSSEQQVENEADPEVLLHMRRERVEPSRGFPKDVTAIPVWEPQKLAEAAGH